MGLLSDTPLLKNLQKICIEYTKKLAAFLYIGSILVFIAFCHNFLNNGNYFSENALMAGLATSTYSLANANSASNFNTFNGAEISSKFREINGIVYNTSDGSILSVLHSSRGSPHESFIIHAPFSMKTGQQTISKNYGIGLVLSIAELFSQQNYWSKDVLFIISDDVHKLDLTKHVNSIYSAVTIELESENPAEIEFAIVGHNGQLPNLDLRNVLERLMYYAQEESSFPEVNHFHGKRPSRNNKPVGGMWKNRLIRPNSPQADDVEGLIYDVETTFEMLKKLAGGKSDGHHGDFLLRKIEALTIRGIGSEGKFDLKFIGYLVEGVSRSVNNLLELFHQSFFYYLLPRTDRYMSNGDYCIPLIMLILIPLVFGVKFWFSEDGTDFDDNISEIPSILFIVTTVGLLSHANIWFSLIGVVAPQVHKFYRNKFSETENPTEVKLGNKILALYCIVIASCMLSASLINFSLVFLSCLVIIPIMVPVIDGRSKVACFVLNCLPVLAFQTFLQEAPTLYSRYSGDFLTYNYVVFFLIPCFTCLRFFTV